MSLRAYGLSHDALKNVKKTLNFKKNDAYPIMDIALLLCIPFVRVGKRQIRYRLSDVKSYMASRVCQSTSQELA